MTKALTVTTFDNKMFGTVRGGEINGKPWFVGSDLAVSLGYKRPNDAVRKHVPDKHKRLMRLDDPEGSTPNRRGIPATAAGNPHHTIIDEAGMYRLIFHSKLKAADDFVEWVTADVLPTLRKTGTYSTGVRLMTPEVQALMDGKTDDEIRVAMQQYNNRVAGNAKRKATNAAKRAAEHLSDDQIVVAIARAISSKLYGGRFGEGTLAMYDVIESRCRIPLRDRQKMWQMGRGVGTPSSAKRSLYSFILPEEIPGVLQALTAYCSENGVDVSGIISKRIAK